MYHCGNCGASLDERELAQGWCRICGAYITAEGNVRQANPIQDSVPTWPRAQDDGPAIAARPSARSPRRATAILLLGLAVVAVVVGILAILNLNGLTKGSTASMTTNPPTIVVHATATSVHHPTPQMTSTPSGNPTATTDASTATPSPTTTPSPTATPSPTPVPPTLVVTPTQITFQHLECLTINGASKTVTIENSGTGTINWHVTSMQGYGFNPANGSVMAGGSETFQVTGVRGPGTITVTAQAGVANAPQTINVICAPR